MLNHNEKRKLSNETFECYMNDGGQQECGNVTRGGALESNEESRTGEGGQCSSAE